MGTLINEINEILSNPFEGEVELFVESKLTPESLKVFKFLPSSFSSQLLLDRDPHGNVQVAKIDTEKLIILLMQQELEKRKNEGQYNGNFNP